MLIITNFLCIFAPKFCNLLINFIIMISHAVLLRFANKSEWFKPFYVEATPNGIGFNADKKFMNYIIASFSDLHCVVSVRSSFDQNCYYYVIQESM